jgi:hypothetical protein
MIQDADDWGAPHRAAILLHTLLRDRADLAVSAQPQFAETVSGMPFQIGMRWSRLSTTPTQEKFVVQTALTKDFVYRIPHAGLLKIDALRRVGGYFGGFRIGWDTLLTNLILMTGSISWTPDMLYHRLVRPDSLTHSAATGVRSGYSASVYQCQKKIYDDCYAFYRAGENSDIDGAQVARHIRNICQRYVTSADALELDRQARALRGVLHSHA